MFLKDIGQIPIHVFLIHIDFIFKILRILLNGSLGLFGVRLFENRQSIGFKMPRFYKNIICSESVPENCLYCF